MTIDKDFSQTKISELITKLKDVFNEHGDLYVCHSSTGGYFEAVSHVDIANDSIIGGDVCYLH